MRYFYICILFTFSLLNTTIAQSWKQLSKEAAALAKQGRFAESAAKYESAWQLKPKKTEFIAKAAQYYRNIRDYKRSAEAFRNIKDNKDFPLAKYYFASALKQDGQYTEASRELSEFINVYQGSDKEKYSTMVQEDIKGCELAQQLMKPGGKPTVQLARMAGQINSMEADFAPVPFADDILYFSSTVSGKAVIYRSQKSNGAWSKAIVPQGIPENKEKNVCNGSFSPDFKRFYYTECGDNIGRLEATCKIFMIEKNASGWSNPIALREAINAVGANVSQPTSTQNGEKEILYFASDMDGSIGGMDIWYVTRNISAGSLDFSNPVNLGPLVNTSGDEITPYYDASEDVLYFSSNKHISIGGFDIFKTKGSDKNWSKPENAGLPFNSNADDYYFIKNKSKTGGFVVSNRIYGKEKTTTTNEDLFEFSNPSKNLAIRGQLLEKENSSAVADVRLTLYEVMVNAQKRVLQTKTSVGNEYEFVLLPEKKYRLESEKKGYKTAFYEFSSSKKDSMNNGYSKNMYLEKTDKASGTSVSTYVEDAAVKKNTPPATNSTATTNTPVKTNVPTTNNTNTNTGSTAVTTPPKTNSNPANNTNATASKSTTSTDVVMTNKGTATEQKTTVPPANKTATSNPNRPTGTSVGVLPLYEITGPSNEQLLTSAPKQQGIYYKIQVLATKDFDPDEYRYRPIRDYGRLDSEYIIGKNLSRVLIAEFFNYDDAYALLPQIQQNKEFRAAYIVKYQDGRRVGTGK
jgi:tetratricopeptide (TPR) repeat protein